MTQEESSAVVRLLRRMNEMQRQISKPTRDDATEEEVLNLFRLLWTWTSKPKYDLPSKGLVEALVGWMRGCESREYCYISLEDVASIIRKASKDPGSIIGPVFLNEGAEKMNDTDLFVFGMWNYKPSSLVRLLYDVHMNPDMYNSYGDRK